MQFLDLIKSMKAEEATRQNLFGEAGSPVSSSVNKTAMSKKVKETIKLIAGVQKGEISEVRLREALTTSDFPLIFGRVLDVQLMNAHRIHSMPFRNYIKISTVRDFRTVERYAVDGADDTLDQVPQSGEYPESALGETKYSYSVNKYGRRIPLSWESIINDDLGALQDIPKRFGRAAARSEQLFATQIYCQSTGANDNIYKTSNNNIVSGNPSLDISALQTGMEQIASQTDANGEPILIDTLHLVVPPALEITAQNLLNSLQLELSAAGGTSSQKLITSNWMKNRIKLHVDPYIPIVSSSANGNTCWFLFADPANNRPAIEMGFLRGNERPKIFVKHPNAMTPGGSTINSMAGDFDTDSIQYKVRHVFGGTAIDPKMTVASDGSDSAE